MDNAKFLAFWGWDMLPWNQRPALSGLFWQDLTHIIRSRLLLAAQKAGNIYTVGAAPGHGKSTFARWLYQNLDQHHVAFFALAKPIHSSDWLMPLLASYVGTTATNTATILKRLGNACTHGKMLTIIIDNAQHLRSPEAFDDLFALTHIQSLRQFLCNIVLIGNSRMLSLCQSLPEVEHRVIPIGEIQPFSRAELQSYIALRLDHLGLNPRSFSPEAVQVFVQHGVLTFAAVDSLLENCLIEAFFREQKQINGEIANSAFESLNKKKAKDESELAKTARLSQKRRLNPAGLQKTASSQSAAGDLNALYYRSAVNPDGDE